MPAAKSILDGLRQRVEQWRGRFERYLSGQAPTDPFYLTNRTWQEKLKTAALVAVPVLLLVALILIGVTDVFHLHKADPYDHPAAEAAPPTTTARTHLPDPKLAPAGLEVVDIRIARNSRPPAVTGIIRNNTDHSVSSAEVTYLLADTDGSLVGVETAAVANLKPHASAAFRSELKSGSAEFVLVREVRAN
ncbi:MAG TPA: FxLYD domain-containing protein [Bryobacteraceae bacterium]|nr:FxLYD domain-containing protein [Bryobacteraceae bacterium]